MEVQSHNMVQKRLKALEDTTIVIGSRLEVIGFALARIAAALEKIQDELRGSRNHR